MTKLTEEYINLVISGSKIEYIKMGKKTTIAHVTLPNGFEIVGTSACVDPENYEQAVGEKIALEHAKTQIWLLEGYLLQEGGLS